MYLNLFQNLKTINPTFDDALEYCVNLKPMLYKISLVDKFGSNSEKLFNIKRMLTHV